MMVPLPSASAAGDIRYAVGRMAITAGKLAEQLGAELRGDASRPLEGCNGIEQAGPRDLTFVANRKYAAALTTTKAGAVVLSAEDAKAAPPHLTVLVAGDPYFAFREAVVALHGFRRQPPPGISPLAVVDPTAAIGQGCSIGPFAVIAAGARLGSRCVIYPHTYIGPGAVIGDDCILYASVTIYDGCVLGQRVILHAGCVVGQDGFGYATTRLPGEETRHHKIPQVGNAVIEDDVEMGAGCTIDRATVGSTRVGKGAKFSDQVAIGHGAAIGRHNLFVAQVGIAGSTTTGDYVVMGGQVGVAGHLSIGAGVQLAAQAGVMTDIPPGEKYGGQPAMPLNQAKRIVLAMTRVPDLIAEVKELRKRIEELESRKP